MIKIKIGNYKVEKLLVDIYIDHFAKDKNNIILWENQRKTLHNSIFAIINLDRFSKEGREFEEELDKYCEPKIAKYDIFVARTKKLVRAKTKEEIKVATTMLKLELEKKKFSELAGIRDKPVYRKDVNKCRICDKELIEGIGRVNDHMAVVRGFNEIYMPICSKCSDDNPDEYHVAFRSQYWNR